LNRRVEEAERVPLYPNGVGRLLKRKITGRNLKYVFWAAAGEGFELIINVD